MAISPNGTTLLVGDADGAVRVQRVADGQVLNTIPGQSPVTVVAWSPKGRRLAIGRLDGTSEVYSLDPLQRMMLNSGSGQVSVLGFVGENGLMRESSTGSIARYDLAALLPGGDPGAQRTDPCPRCRGRPDRAGRGQRPGHHPRRGHPRADRRPRSPSGPTETEQHSRSHARATDQQ